MGRGEPGRLGLEEGADGEELVGLLLRRLVHERALRRPQIHPALGVQPLQRLPHRLPRHTEVTCELTLDQMLAGLQGAGRDEFEQRLVDTVAQRAGTFELGHRTLR